MRVRPLHAVLGALTLGSTLSATALALAEAPLAAQVPGGPRPTLVLRDARLGFGQAALVRGRVPAADAGRDLMLQYAPAQRGWRTVGTTTVRPGGTYRVQARLRGSGTVRVLLAAPAGAGAAAAEAGAAGPARHVAVAARLFVGHGGRDVQAGGTVRVRGTLLPRTRGRLVVVEGRVGRAWRVLARTRTRADGHFLARVATRGLGSIRLRARFAGDRANAAVGAGAGSLRSYRATLASWYALYGGALACGGTLGYGTLGVANKTLPCGTMVTLRYRGRSVTVPVIDRGPYAGGREWDLTGATARRLRFDGMGVVWSTR